jgi:hypothetical protein
MLLLCMQGAHVSSSTARRELLLGATAATAAVAISQLLQPQAARAEPFASVIDNDDDEVVAPAAPQAAEEAAEAPAAAAQQPAPGTLTQVTTPVRHAAVTLVCCTLSLPHRVCATIVQVFVCEEGRTWT